MYDQTSVLSILEFAKKLEGFSLGEMSEIKKASFNEKWKGRFWQMLEKYYFWYEPNSDSQADFPEAWLELKSSSLKIIKSGDYKSKEKLILNIINYIKVIEENFEESTFWKKNSHLLLVFYLFEEEKNIIDYRIKLVNTWEFPAEDLLIIKNDWDSIKVKISAWLAHELSESDTFYLSAATKWGKGWNPRKQPNSDILAKQRAYSLKWGYVNHIIATISGKRTNYGKIIKTVPKILDLEESILSKFRKYYHMTPSEIEASLDLTLNNKALNYYASISKAILWIAIDKQIEEFEKASIEIRSVRLNEKWIPEQDSSFPIFKYEELINEEWQDSEFRNTFGKKFLFVFFKVEKGKLVLKKVKFWNMWNSDLEEAKEVWEKTIELIKRWTIVRKTRPGTNRKWESITIRDTYFPTVKNRISHVRPHTSDSKNTFPLPIRDIVTWEKEYTKHCFWLNKKYIKDTIYP